MTRSTRFLVAAILTAATVTIAASFFLGGPERNPVRLRAALDTFTGEWEGEAALHARDGQALPTPRINRHYFWIGERQIVETHLVLGAEEHVTRAIQWIEHDRLQAVTTGPAGESHTFSGAPTADGILWTNLDHPKSDCLDRIVARDGHATLQSGTIMDLRLGSISGLVGVSAELARREASKPDALPEPAPTRETNELETLAARIADLERQLAIAERERGELRVQLARASASPPRPTEPSRASQLEIRSSPPGMTFEVRVEAARNLIADTELSTGTTPATLSAVPPGDYAVILQRSDRRQTVHHVTVTENRDVFVFHREDGGVTKP